MKKLLLFLCLLAQTGFAQIPRLDSLKQVLTRLQKLPEDYTNDTITYNTLKAIMTGYVDVDIDSSFQYNTRMIRLCQKANLHKELSTLISTPVIFTSYGATTIKPFGFTTKPYRWPKS